MVQFSVQSIQSAQLSKGYAAFNSDDWDTVRALLCPDTPDDAATPDFPVLYPMDGGQGSELKGREKIIDYLRELRAAAAEATLLGVADHGNKSITLDITLGGREGSHACADLVEFDDSGCIKVFRHCSTDTHSSGTQS
jgi:hypothetical protein